MFTLRQSSLPAPPASPAINRYTRIRFVPQCPVVSAPTCSRIETINNAFLNMTEGENELLTTCAPLYTLVRIRRCINDPTACLLLNTGRIQRQRCTEAPLAERGFGIRDTEVRHRIRIRVVSSIARVARIDDTCPGCAVGYRWEHCRGDQ